VLPWWEGADEAQSRCSFSNLIPRADHINKPGTDGDRDRPTRTDSDGDPQPAPARGTVPIISTSPESMVTARLGQMLTSARAGSRNRGIVATSP
jgi:hypothetical protein